jgi:lysozyme
LFSLSDVKGVVLMQRPLLRMNSRGGEVRTLQQALARAGFSPGPIDGEFGPKTLAAVRAFQRAKGLEVDGIVGPRTWGALLPSISSAVSSAAVRSGHHSLSDQGAAFIARFEGFRAKLYNDPTGHCSIGYGHLVHRGPINGTEPAEFRNGISQQRAVQLLKSDAAVAASAVNEHVEVNLAQHQFDALVSFTFNVGTGAFGGSTLLKQLNAARFDAVPGQLRLWNKGGGKVLPGLVTRREAEATLFTTGHYGV